MSLFDYDQLISTMSLLCRIYNDVMTPNRFRQFPQSKVCEYGSKKVQDFKEFKDVLDLRVRVRYRVRVRFMVRLR